MTACPACGADCLEPFYTVDRLPVQSCVLLDSRAAAAAYPTGRIDLANCLACGFIANTAFDPAAVDYTQSYEESQEFSPRFMEFASELADTLVARHGLAGGSVFEVGCGKGSFLALLVRRGVASAIGIDPSADPARLPDDVAGEIEIVRAFFSAADERYTGDLVVCRHTLEHIQPVLEFARLLRRAAAHTAGSALFVEVPDVERILAEGAFWDVYYEHCSYFTAGSLHALLSRAGCTDIDVALGYGDQYLLATARPGASVVSGGDHAGDVAALARSFGADVAEKIDRWKTFLAERDGDTVVVWGAGSKGGTFVNTMGEHGAGISAVVDINPHMQGTFIAGCGHEIIAPERLREYRPDAVIVMNPLYVDEISASLAELGLAPEIVAV